MSEESDIYYLHKSYLKENWESSFGLDLSKDHFRESPPGTAHAVCEPGDEVCRVHYDEYNPHENLLEHLVEDEPDLLDSFGPAISTAVEVYSETDSKLRAIKSALAMGTGVLECIYRGFAYEFSFIRKELAK